MIIYLIENLINHKIYIGQTICLLKTRIYAHHRDMKATELGRLKSNYLYNAMNKYGFNNFKFSVIDTANTIKQLCKLEKYYIKKYNSIKSGYNLVKGGRGNWGWKVPEDTKLKISNSNKGRFAGNKNPATRNDVKILLKQNNIWNNPKLINLQNKLSKKLSIRMKLNNPMKKMTVRKKVSETRIREGTAKGKKNGNYKGGKVEVKCLFCEKSIFVFPCRVKTTKFCSWNCKIQPRKRRLI